MEDRIIIVANGEDRAYEYSMFGVTFDSSEEEILNAVAPMVRESLGVDLSESGRWLFKTRKATSNRNTYIIPNSTAGSESSLSYLDDATRLEVFDNIVRGCKHLWSKNQLMDGVNEVKDAKGNTVKEDRLTAVWNTFARLAQEDPLFLAHFTSYALRKLEDKDIKVLAALASTLSDADGTPFAPGSQYTKPNWRVVGQAAVAMLEPKLVLRVVRLALYKKKWGTRAEATHYSKSLRTAVRKYLRYREANPKMLEGIARSGLTSTYRDLYRVARIAPSPEACRILRWKQKPGYPGATVTIDTKRFDFTGLSDLEVAEKIRAEKLSPLVTLGALKSKLSPVVAAAVLEQASGDQAIIFTEMLEEQGILQHKEVKELYETKVKAAKNTLDRVDRIQATLTQETKALLEKTKSDKRKEDVGDLGKIYLHIDKSGSMQSAIALAIESGTILAECIKEPTVNFHWGLFNERGVDLPRPKTFERAAFQAALYGQHAGGGTNCLALYQKAREYGCTTDIYITDQGHFAGSLEQMIDQFRAKGLPDPRQVIIVDVRANAPRLIEQPLKQAFEAKGIPVVMLKPEDLKQSALVTQAVKTAIKGQKAILDDVLAEPLLSLPKWWHAVPAA